MKYGAWNVSKFDPEDVAALNGAGYSPLVARALSARGCATAGQAEAYLAADAPLLSPFLMQDMKTAADLVRLAVARNEHIAVFGDYDVDGITATCLMTDFLRAMGARVTSYIPDRLEEGYGLNPLAIETLYRQQVSLIITVDCGITANDEAELCRKLGIQLIITDHHECKDVLPRAAAVVNPHRRDDTYPHTGLSGVGIAFQLASAICGDQAGVLERYADLVCLGLIADVMPLQGEVRTLVVRGLRALEQARRPGVAALMQECGCSGQPVTTATVGYLLAPRINAAGRMGQVDLAIRLFLTQDPDEAAALAAALCRLNRERQKVEAGIYQQAVAMLGDNTQPKAIVLAGETWHQGVVGIVASRLSEEYGCPTFLICMDGERGKASSRSYGGFNLFSALSRLSPLLESYGGHELAAGFTISRANIPQFRAQITRLAEQFQQSGQAESALRVDCCVEPELLTMQNIEALRQLEPCGTGCPSPVFCLENVTVEHLAEVSSGKHMRLRLRYGKRPSEVLSGIFFSTSILRAGIAVDDQVDVAFTPQINEYRDLRTVQLNLADIRPCRQVRQVERSARSLYQRYRTSLPITAQEAGSLLPVRSEFVAVWRYLVAHCGQGDLCEEFFCLSRKIQRSSSAGLTTTKTKICLDVFAEQGLISLRKHPGYYSIRITTDGRKVDLDSSAIVQDLKRRRAGKS